LNATLKKKPRGFHHSIIIKSKYDINLAVNTQ